ncbi:transporter, partial [Paracoccus liaowanqingii]
MTRLSRIAGLALLALTVALPARAESLADTMVAAYRHSALIEQNRAVLRAADEGVAASVAALRPVVEWVARQTAARDEGSTTSRSTSMSLAASLTLYDFGRSQLAIDGAKEQVLATRQALVSVEQDILLAATLAFFQVREAIQQVALQENSVEVLTSERQAAQDRFDVGEITVTDVALADAALAATRASLASANGDLEIARESYLASTGRQPVSLDAPPPLPSLPATLDEARRIAQTTHPAIGQSQRQAAAAEISVA